MHGGLRCVVYGSLGGTGHADVTAFGYNDHNNSRKRYLFIYLYDILYCADHREHNLLALNLGLKYEIQVPNIGGYALGPPTKLLGVQAPYSTPMSY